MQSAKRDIFQPFEALCKLDLHVSWRCAGGRYCVLKNGQCSHCKSVYFSYVHLRAELTLNFGKKHTLLCFVWKIVDKISDT